MEEARKMGKLDRFIKEHPTKGDSRLFDNMLNLMAQPIKKIKSGGRTSKKD